MDEVQLIVQLLEEEQPSWWRVRVSFLGVRFDVLLNFPPNHGGCRYEINGLNAGRVEVMRRLCVRRVLSVCGKLDIRQMVVELLTDPEQSEVLDRVLTEVRFIPEVVSLFQSSEDLAQEEAIEERIKVKDDKSRTKEKRVEEGSWKHEGGRVIGTA
jgi:hypothetical protein